MDPKLAFWLASFVLMSAVVALGVRGRVLVRRGNVDAHRRAMHAAAALIGLFVAAYLAKVLVLGREDRSAWSPTLLATLYVHETFIALMLASGIATRLLARRHPTTPWHRYLGRTALATATAALATAALLLAGMWRLATG